ncbi:UNVERIFIED_CONTAM: rsmH [Trichonephila clavipes]
MNGFQHLTVLCEETVDAVLGDRKGCYVDATFGRGGHSRQLLASLAPEARLIAFDKDPEAIAAGEALAAADARFSIVHDSFATLAAHVEALGLTGRVTGLLADLGVSSPQLDDAARGFSFMNDGPLDMRMDPTRGVSAADWLAGVSEADLADALKTYGEERHARRIARALVAARAKAAITTTRQLAELVAAAHPAWEKHKHPATRSFQAIRIVVNRELGDLEDFLDQALAVLAPGGRLAVISFHSLEDRLVKQFIQKAVKGDDFPPGLPVTWQQLRPQLKKIGKAVEPSEAEVDRNPRARSARLRIAERLAEAGT